MTRAVSRSVPMSKVTASVYEPSLPICEDMYIMFSTPLTCCSIGAATVSATTWALAPGYWQVTITFGGAFGGYIAMVSCQYPGASAQVGAETVAADRKRTRLSSSHRGNCYG